MRRTGRPRTVSIDVVHAEIAQCLEDDRQWSLQELQAHTSIDQAAVHKILREDLHMLKVVLRTLIEQKIWYCYETCRIHLEWYQNEGDNLLNNIITTDETWVRAYEPKVPAS